MSKDIATKFMLKAVQDWGQSERERIVAVQDLLDAAGFRANAHSAPVFGVFYVAMQKPCSGPDGIAAWDWLRKLLNTMPRGKFEREVEHIEAAIAKRRSNLETGTPC